MFCTAGSAEHIFHFGPKSAVLLSCTATTLQVHSSWRLAILCRDDMPTSFQGVHSMRCFVWQVNMVLMSRFVRDAMRMVRAASSGDELDV